MSMLRLQSAAAFSLLLIVAACASAPSGSSSTIVAPSADYVRVGTQFDNEGSSVIVTPGAGIDPEDLTLSLHFGFAVSAHKDDEAAQAAGRSLKGAGDRPESAFVIDGLAKQEYAVEVAFSFIAKMYPARRDIRAFLLNGPGKTYVAMIDFKDGNDVRRLYFDLTGWADAIKAGA